MAKVYKDLESLSKSLKPEIKRLNDQIVRVEMSKIESQASRLLRDINSMWAGYESSYSPVMYNRSGATKSGFKLSPPRITSGLDGTRVEVDLILDDDYMWHSSLFGYEKNRGHSFMLISEGWHASGLESYLGKSVYRLTEFEGVGIIDSLTSQYNDRNYEFKFYHEGQEV